MTEILEAELTWIGGRFESGVRVVLGADGRIAEVGPAPDRSDAPVRKLDDRALVPGLVNAHSHAFQRGLRGHGERFPAGAGSFWSWREAMYGLVERMDAETLHALSLLAFREMLAAGITAVGEFHYLHHDRTGAGWALDQAVLDAAREAGIRIVLLQAYYRTGSIGRPLVGAQERFGARSLGEYWEQFDRLEQSLERRTQSLGCVVHSIRTASLEDLASVHAEARRRGLVFHMHLEEQEREVTECRAAYGATPMGLVNERLEVDRAFTAVHCTQSNREDLERFLSSGGNACVCPLTEANLGDGICDLPAILEREGTVCLGTDSNARISMIEEMRWLEYVQRLARRERGVGRDEGGAVARRLLAAATAGGARSLGLDTGAIRPGAWADLVALDLTAPALAGWTPETLLDSLVFGAGDEVLAEVCVAGRWI